MRHDACSDSGWPRLDARASTETRPGWAGQYAGLSAPHATAGYGFLGRSAGAKVTVRFEGCQTIQACGVRGVFLKASTAMAPMGRIIRNTKPHIASPVRPTCSIPRAQTCPTILRQRGHDNVHLALPSAQPDICFTRDHQHVDLGLSFQPHPQPPIMTVDAVARAHWAGHPPSRGGPASAAPAGFSH
jgi:hypothetical protein